MALIGVSSSSGVILVNQQTFIANGTWTKPTDAAPGDLVIVDLWGGGGSGGIRGTSSTQVNGAGGSGGAHNRIQFRVYELANTELVVVGVGGAANTGTALTDRSGADGSPSSFKGYYAYGGLGPNYTGSLTYVSGSGTKGVGYANSNPTIGGNPQEIIPADISYSDFGGTAGVFAKTPGEWGGGFSFINQPHQRPIHGGAGNGHNSTNALDRSSIWGGAGGGGGDSVNSQIGGTSQFGGNGGSSTFPPSNAANVNGVNGSPRGGGGSGAKWGSTGTVTSGAGGRGEAVITILRGI